MRSPTGEYTVILAETILLGKTFSLAFDQDQRCKSWKTRPMWACCGN